MHQTHTIVLLQMKGSVDHQMKILSTRVPHGDQDPHAVKPMFEFDPYDKSYGKLQ